MQARSCPQSMLLYARGLFKPPAPPIRPWWNRMLRRLFLPCEPDDWTARHADVRRFARVNLEAALCHGEMLGRWWITPTSEEPLAEPFSQAATPPANPFTVVITDHPARHFAINFATDEAEELCLIETVDPDGRIERRICRLHDGLDGKCLGDLVMPPIILFQKRSRSDPGLPAGWVPRSTHG